MTLSQQTECAECGLEINEHRKFCSDRCKDRYNVQRFINEVMRRTISITEASKVLGLSPSTLRNRIRKNDIEQFNINGRIRIRKTDAMRLA